MDPDFAGRLGNDFDFVGGRFEDEAAAIPFGYSESGRDGVRWLHQSKKVP